MVQSRVFNVFFLILGTWLLKKGSNLCQYVSYRGAAVGIAHVMYAAKNVFSVCFKKYVRNVYVAFCVSYKCKKMAQIKDSSGPYLQM